METKKSELKGNKDSTKQVAKPFKKVVDYMKELGPKGAKNRAEFGQLIFDAMKKDGLTKNIKGFTIEVDNVKAQVSALTRDINQERGKGKGGWWCTWVVVENDNEFKLMPRKQP
jgi:hypothetical protein